MDSRDWFSPLWFRSNEYDQYFRLASVFHVKLLYSPSLSLSFPLPIFSSFSSFFHFIPSPFFFSFLSFVSNYRGKTEGTPGNFSLPDKRKALSSALIFRVNGLLRDTIMENISLGADRRTVYNIKIIFFSEYLFSFFFIFFFSFFSVSAGTVWDQDEKKKKSTRWKWNNEAIEDEIKCNRLLWEDFFFF